MQMTPPVAVSPTVPAPPTVAEPTPSPAAPQAVQPPTPQPLIRVPLDIEPEAAPPAQAANEPAAAPAAVRPPPVRAERAERGAPSARTTAEPVVESVAPETAAVDDMAPAAATPEMLPAAPMVDTPPAIERTAGGNDFPWEIAGGAVALLLVGGTALAFARRRRALHNSEANAHDIERAAEVLETSASVYAAPDEAVVATPTLPKADPAGHAPIEPQYRSTPAFATAPHGSMGRHEAIALTGPTPGNPFATLRKRLQRARFLDRRERLQYEATLAEQKDMRRKPVSAWEIAQRETPAPAEQEVRRPERGHGRAGDLRPGWLRS